VVVGNIGIIKLLLAAGATVDAEDPIDGSTAMHVAAEKGLEEVVELLVNAAGPKSLNRFDEVGCTPLCFAVRNRYYRCAEILIKAGSDVNARDETRADETALYYAVQNIDVPMVRLLRKAGANPTIPGFCGITVLERAKRITDPRRDEILELLTNDM
jgi:ankyrin repeat protein